MARIQTLIPDWNVCICDEDLFLEWRSIPDMGSVTIWERDRNLSLSPCNGMMLYKYYGVWNTSPSAAVEISQKSEDKLCPVLC